MDFPQFDNIQIFCKMYSYYVSVLFYSYFFCKMQGPRIKREKLFLRWSMAAKRCIGYSELVPTDLFWQRNSRLLLNLGLCSWRSWLSPASHSLFAEICKVPWSTKCADSGRNGEMESFSEFRLEFKIKVRETYEMQNSFGFNPISSRSSLSLWLRPKLIGLSPNHRSYPFTLEKEPSKQMCLDKLSIGTTIEWDVLKISVCKVSHISCRRKWPSWDSSGSR